MRLLISLCCSITAILGDPVVESPLGVVTGKVQEVLNVKIECFVGIPYAKPPLGDLRFAPPQAFGSLGDFQATEFGASCLQLGPGPLAPKNRRVSEDCLTLNVFRKRGTSKNATKAVIATLHGGGYQAGSASDPIQNAAPLAGIGDLIVVSFNYRLGILGFADMGGFAPGNLGLRDQRLALEWIQDHIADFGGDPNLVTVMGVSAGSMSLAAHILTTIDNKNLFRSAIMDAGVVNSNGFHEDPESSYIRMKKIAKQLDCPIDSMEMVDCLRKVDAQTLISFSMNTTGDNGIPYFVATTDGVFIPRDLEKYVRENRIGLRKVRALVGYAKDEGTFFVGTRFLADDFRNPESEDEILDHCEAISRNYNHLLDFSKESTRRAIIESYVNQHPKSAFLAVAALQSDFIFKCPVNDFIQDYSKHNHEVYVYQFERKMQGTYARILDPNVLGVYHMSPYLHFSGAIFSASDSVPLSDRSFILDSMNLVAGFAKSDDAIRFRGIEWPSFSESREILIFDEEPSLARGLPSEENCHKVFARHEQPRVTESKSEL